MTELRCIRCDGKLKRGEYNRCCKTLNGFKYDPNGFYLRHKSILRCQAEQTRTRGLAPREQTARGS